jgi:hypothetical protein
VRPQACRRFAFRCNLFCFSPSKRWSIKTDKKGEKAMFKVNEANWDRIARVVLGIVLLVLGLGGTVGGVLGIVLDILGVILLVTGLVGFGPLYTLFKFSTKK